VLVKAGFVRILPVAASLTAGQPSRLDSLGFRGSGDRGLFPEQIHVDRQLHCGGIRHGTAEDGVPAHRGQERPDRLGIVRITGQDGHQVTVLRRNT